MHRWMLVLALAGCPAGIPDGTTETDDTDVVGPIDADGDGSLSDEDCDDDDPERTPGADEICDGKDNDCDEDIDEDAIDAEVYYSDGDRDGFGAEGEGTLSCMQPPDTADRGGDCDDEDPAINPDATEVCDEADVDENCNGTADDADDTTDPSSMGVWHVDADLDGFGDPSATLLACDAAEGRVLDGTDCDDSDPLVNPRDGCPGRWDGDWDAKVTLDVSVPELGSSDTCSFALGLRVEAGAKPEVTTTRTGTCTFATIGVSSAAVLEGDFVAEDRIDATLTVGADAIVVDGRFTDGPPTLQAKGTETILAAGLKATVTHSLTASPSR